MRSKKHRDDGEGFSISVSRPKSFPCDSLVNSLRTVTRSSLAILVMVPEHRVRQKCASFETLSNPAYPTSLLNLYFLSDFCPHYPFDTRSRYLRHSKKCSVFARDVFCLCFEYTRLCCFPVSRSRRSKKSRTNRPKTEDSQCPIWTYRSKASAQWSSAPRCLLGHGNISTQRNGDL